MPDTTRLSTHYTVAKYNHLVKQCDRSEISKLFLERFTERYFAPIDSAPREKKHGFCTMAISCLIIEALESFFNGWENTRARGRGEDAFRRFFHRTNGLAVLVPHAHDFYWHVRCGILHQAETTGGWHIRRSGPLFSERSLTVNATKFHGCVEESLRAYAHDLEVSGWDEEIWVNFRKKMKQVCENCSASP